MTAGSKTMPPSLWAATAPAPPATAPLVGDARTGVAVVGGGFTGLSTALHLAEAGVPVTLLEAEAIGWGASGRNNGQVIPTLSRIDPDEIAAAVAPEHGGREKGEQLVGLIRDSAAFTFDLIRRHGIAAEAVQNGWIQPAHRDSRLKLSEARAAQWGRRGAPVRMYSRAEMAALTGTDHWHGGWGNATGGRINPLGLARGMAAAAIGAGAVIHTGSPVRAIRPATGGWLLETPRGTLAAERVVIATQAHTDDLWPGLKRSIVPVRSYQMATSVLSDNIRKSILPEGHALSDTRGDLYFYRFDANGRLVTGGGLIVPFGWDGRIRARITERLRRVFPQIGDDIRFDYTWWGYIAATADRMPHVYELAPGVLGWTGCNGRGVALATSLGRELALASNGTPLREIAAPVETRIRTIPGHAFRSIGIAWNVAKARRLDARD
jgi:glycine/D-amino acid oxidase-like deaminating enzyme